MSDLYEKADAFARLKEKIQRGTGWTEVKSEEWFLTKNPHLGNIAPFKLITEDRLEYLERWIDSALQLKSVSRRIALIDSPENPITKEHGST